MGMPRQKSVYGKAEASMKKVCLGMFLSLLPCMFIFLHVLPDGYKERQPQLVQCGREHKCRSKYLLCGTRVRMTEQ